MITYKPVRFRQILAWILDWAVCGECTDFD